MPDSEVVVVIDYTNYRGERRLRRISPISGTMRFAETPHHKPAQWVFDAFDVEKGPCVRRTFALASIHEWQGRR